MIKVDAAKFLEENDRMFSHIAMQCGQQSSGKLKKIRDNGIGSFEATADLKQEARLHALRALESFDYENHPIESLGNYVYTVALNGTREYVMANANNIRVPESLLKQKKILDEAAGEQVIKLPKSFNVEMYERPDDNDGPRMSLSGLAIDDAPRPDEAAQTKEEVTILMEELAALHPSEQYVLKERWFEGATLDDIAVRNGVTKQRIYNLQSKAMEKLRRKVSLRINDYESVEDK